MGTAPEITAQETEVEGDELDSALEALKPGEQETEVKVETETEVETEVKTEVETETETKTEVAVDPTVEENRALRQMLRDQKREMSLIKARLDRTDKKATAALDEDDEALKQEHSPIEALADEMNRISAERGAQLEVLADMMAETQKYGDIYDVCTKENFSDMFEVLGEGIAQRERIPVEQAMLQAEVAVWSMGNPYKYMYGLIKEHHPKYKQAEEVVKPGVPKPTVVKKPAEAPASIAGIGGSDTSKTGWTAKRIDDLPEDELDKVPVDVYDKYLKGTLK